MCGDFNVVPDTTTDVSALHPRGLALAYLVSFVHQTYMICGIASSPQKGILLFSKLHLTDSKIDLFVTDQSLLQSIFKSEIHTVTWFNHAPVSICVGGAANRENMTMWRNDPILMDKPTTVQFIRCHVEEFFEINSPSVDKPFVTLNSHKPYVRELLIKLGVVAKHQRTQQLNSLLFNIVKLEETLKLRV